VRYLLDTNAFIAAMKGVGTMRERLQQVPVDALVLSPVVLGELSLGVAKSSFPQRNRARLAAVTAELELAPIDLEVVRHYADIRATLERQGTPIGSNDYWIAAQGRALAAVLVTENENEFARVPELAVENWLR
jgi:tRNA(fMet)-specific endonuclease VapC